MTWEVKFQILLGWVIATMFKTKYKNYKLTKCKKNVGTKTKPNGNPTLDFGVFGLIVVDLIKNKPDHFPVCLFLRMNAVLKPLLGKLTLELNGVLPRMRLQYGFEMDGIPRKSEKFKTNEKSMFRKKRNKTLLLETTFNWCLIWRFCILHDLLL